MQLLRDFFVGVVVNFHQQRQTTDENFTTNNKKIFSFELKAKKAIHF